MCTVMAVWVINSQGKKKHFTWTFVPNNSTISFQRTEGVAATFLLPKALPVRDFPRFNFSIGALEISTTVRR